MALNPWMDQVTAINDLMDSLGQKSEAPIIRDLIDEALAARRRKSAQVETKTETPSTPELAPTLEIIQGLLLKLFAEAQTALRIESVNLELLQETLVEARTGRMMLWEILAVPALRDRGKIAFQIAELLETHVNEGKNFSYGLAEEVKAELDAAEVSKRTEQESSQPSLHYEDNTDLELNDSDFGQTLS